MNRSNLCPLLVNFLRMFVEDLCKTGRDAIFFNILKVLQFYLWKNSEHQVLFYQVGIYQTFISTIFKYYPKETVEFIHLTVLSSPRVFISKKDNLVNILDLHVNVRKLHKDDFGSMKKLLDIAHLHLNKKFKDILFDLPSLDLKISEYLVEELPFWRLENIQVAISEIKTSPSKFEYLQKLFGLISDSLHFRVINFKMKVKLMTALSPETLLKIISMNKEDAIFHKICIQLFDRIYIKLLDENEQTKELVIDYLSIFNFFTHELASLKEMKNLNNLFEPFKKLLYKSIFRFTNFILNFVDSRLIEYIHYSQRFQELLNLIIDINNIDGEEDLNPYNKSQDKLVNIEFSNGKLNEKQKLSLRKLLKSLQENILPIIQPQIKQKKRLFEFNRSINMNSGCYENVFAMEDEKVLHKHILVCYQNFKNEITILNPEKNQYFKVINSSNKDIEQRDSVRNLCLFLINQLRQSNWTYEKKRMRYKIMKCLSNIFYYCTLPMQTSFDQILENNEYNTAIMDVLWVQLRKKINYVKCINNMNSLYFQTFEECLMLIKLHQFLCEDNNFKFKNWFRLQILPDSKKNRIIDLFETFINLCNSMNWSTNYQVNEIEDFPVYTKEHLFKLGIFIFDFINETLSGPCNENQLEVIYIFFIKFRYFLFIINL